MILRQAEAAKPSILNGDTLIDLIKSLIPKVNEKHSHHLFFDKDGKPKDRKLLIGSSNIGACLLHSYLNKVAPKPITDEQKFIMTTGQIAEHVYIDYWNMINKIHNTCYHIQYEVEDKEFPWAVMHSDNLFADHEDITKAKKIYVIECKYTLLQPEVPYPRWMAQLQWQMGLLKRHLPNKDVEIEGQILASDYRTFMTEFGRIYKPSDLFMNNALDRGKLLLDAIKNEKPPVAEPNVMECSFCPHRLECKAFTGYEAFEVTEDFREILNQLAEWKAQKAIAEKHYKAFRQQAIDFVGEALCGKEGGFRMAIDDRVLSMSQAKKKVLDEASFKKNHPDLYAKVVKPVVDLDLLETVAPDIAAQYITVERGATTVQLRS